VSFLVVWRDDDPSNALRQTSDPTEISAAFERIGCGFERLPARPGVGPDVDQDTVLEVYRDVIDEINAAEGFVAVDAINMHPRDDPDWADRAKTMRATFIDEHTHADSEVRFLARGSTAFYVHALGEVHAVHAAAGDLIRVPRGTTHWVDSGPVPDFTVVRFFHDPQGWAATPSGSDISHRFPDFDEVRALAAGGEGHLRGRHM
jgi:1,2-dihydroxy-3-keto-5-methylthiopentene dioxygenase